MNYELSDELKMIRDTAREFTEKEVMLVAEDIEEKDEHPWEIYKKMGNLGFTSVLFPQEYGGSNIGHLALAIIIEELARGSSAVASALFEGVYFCLPIALYGTKEQKKQFIPPFCRGNTHLLLERLSQMQVRILRQFVLMRKWKMESFGLMDKKCFVLMPK